MNALFRAWLEARRPAAEAVCPWATPELAHLCADPERFDYEAGTVSIPVVIVNEGAVVTEDQYRNLSGYAIHSSQVPEAPILVPVRSEFGQSILHKALRDVWLKQEAARLDSRFNLMIFPALEDPQKRRDQ